MTSMEWFNGGCTYIFFYVIFYRRSEPEPEDWSSYESPTSEVTDKSESNKLKKNVERMPHNGKRHRHKYEDSPEGSTFTVLQNLHC